MVTFSKVSEGVFKSVFCSKVNVQAGVNWEKKTKENCDDNHYDSTG